MQGYRYFYIERVIISIWQHLSLLTIRQAHYLRMFLKISRISHFTTLQKSSLQRMISSFIALFLLKSITYFFGIDSSGFKSTHSSQYYSERAKLRKRKKWIKLPASRHDDIDFKPIITRTSEIKPATICIPLFSSGVCKYLYTV